MREVTDSEGLTWTFARAYAGLSQDDQPGDPNEECDVIATPSGGEQTVRLQLAGDWKNALSDDELLARIKAEQGEQDAEGRDA